MKHEVANSSPAAGKYKCDCCGKMTNHVEVLCSGIAAISFKYCDECAKKEVEPYHILVSVFAGTRWNDLTAYWQKIITDSCEVSNHTLEQFKKDCDEYMASCRNWSSTLH